MRSALRQRIPARRTPRGAGGALAIVVAVLAALPCACRSTPPRALPEVTVFSTVGDVPLQVIGPLAEQRGIARVRRVDGASGADLLWTGDPTQILERADVAPGTAPEPGDVDARWRDPARRFAPACARGEVLVVNPRARLPFEPRNLRDLADPRIAGRIALPPLRDPGHLTALTVLAAVYGDASVRRFLDLLDRNRPARAASDREVAALVGRGDADVGLVGTEAAAAGAVSASALEVIYPDQDGRGAVLVPTAVAVTTRGASANPARQLAAFLVGAEAERLLVARVPGWLPLRPGVPVPVGVRPAGNLIAVRSDWERVLIAKDRVREIVRP